MAKCSHPWAVPGSRLPPSPFSQLLCNLIMSWFRALNHRKIFSIFVRLFSNLLVNQLMVESVKDLFLGKGVVGAKGQGEGQADPSAPLPAAVS